MTNQNVGERRRRHHAATTAGLTFLVVAAATLSPAPASAHVRANAWGAAKPGKYGVVVLRVPNEQERARTNEVVVSLPAQHPVADVSVRPVPGWHIEVTKKRLPRPKREGKVTLDQAPSEIRFSANAGSGIAPGQFETFWLSLGPMPTDTDALALPTAQHYDNGTVVDWATPTEPGAPEPEHPAPEIALGGAAPKTASSEPEQVASAAPASDGTARILGGVGIVVGALGAGLGIGAVLRQRKRLR